MPSVLLCLLCQVRRTVRILREYFSFSLHKMKTENNKENMEIKILNIQMCKINTNVFNTIYFAFKLHDFFAITHTL